MTAPRPPSPSSDWSRRWSQLARSVGIGPSERLLVALSGGADSVLLLHLLAAARPRPDVRAVHVDHNLRGRASRDDARFCETLCRALDIPFTLVPLELDPRPEGLEARAREARYAALVDEALRTGHTTLLTGHHSDDQLETLLLRWIRGSALPGLAGLRPRAVLDPRRAFGGAERRGPGRPVHLVRPLVGMRRAEVRRLLSDRGLVWREDATNGDRRFGRARVRHGLVPTLRRLGGDEAVENLRAFGRAVEALEEQLAGATAHLAWRPAPWAAATRVSGEVDLGGVLERAELMRLAPALRRRVLWRLLVEGVGRAPGRGALERVLADLGAGRCARHALASGWTLLLRAREVALVPPLGRGLLAVATGTPRQPELPFPNVAPEPPAGIALTVPGITTLPDGRRVSAEVVAVPRGTPPRAGELEVELDAARLPRRLEVRAPRTGDRFHALGAPGAKPLRRFLADRGVPREERSRVALVVADGEVVWAAGLRPGERHRVTRETTERLVLALHLPPRAAGPAPAPERRRRARSR